MITITTFGIDPYSLRQLSLDLTPRLANLCETSEDDINFFGMEGLMVHQGVEQNTWHVLVKVTLPRKIQIFQKEIADLIHHYVSFLAIHVEIIFEYYLSDERNMYINKDYTRYLTEENSVVIDEEPIEGDSEENIFTGDAFAGIKDKLGE